MLSLLLVVLLIALIIGVFPSWKHSRNWGPVPSSVLLVVLVVVLILMTTH